VKFGCTKLFKLINPVISLGGPNMRVGNSDAFMSISVL